MEEDRQEKETNFLKIYIRKAQFIFVYFRRFPSYNDKYLTNLTIPKSMVCLELNPVPQDGRRRRNH